MRARIEDETPMTEEEWRRRRVEAMAERKLLDEEISRLQGELSRTRTDAKLAGEEAAEELKRVVADKSRFANQVQAAEDKAREARVLARYWEHRLCKLLSSPMEIDDGISPAQFALMEEMSQAGRPMTSDELEDKVKGSPDQALSDLEHLVQRGQVTKANGPNGPHFSLGVNGANYVDHRFGNGGLTDTSKAPESK